MKKCYATIHVWLHDMDHNIDLNYRRKIRPMAGFAWFESKMCQIGLFDFWFFFGSRGLILKKKRTKFLHSTSMLVLLLKLFGSLGCVSLREFLNWKLLTIKKRPDNNFLRLIFLRDNSDKPWGIWSWKPGLPHAICYC